MLEFPVPPQHMWRSNIARLGRFFNNPGDRINSLRRHAEMFLDQQWTLAAQRLTPAWTPPPFDGEVRFALITVNFSTTRFLKLMLLTLLGQESLSRIGRIVIVDNDSRDGGREFLRKLARRVPSITLIENSFFPTHARGMRLGIEWLKANDTPVQSPDFSNVLLFCDTDIIFRRPDTLNAVARQFMDPEVGFAGELRREIYPYPEAQASFIAVRRDLYHHPQVSPLVHHGAPAYFMQRSLHQMGVKLADFPSNSAGYILHRGRAGVAATREFRAWDAHATATTHLPHYMGVEGGEAIWASTETRLRYWLAPEREPELIERVGESLADWSQQKVREQVKRQ